VSGALPGAGLTIGRYAVSTELGRGAMGLVLLAHDPVLQRQVALKFLRPDLKLDAGERELLMQRMRQEARAMARLNHPGIVALHDLGEDPTHGVYLVFEHAAGPTLDATLRRGRLTVEGVARLAGQLGDALTAAHERGIVHRDIKPANIILSEEGAKIADFGVARLPESTLTRAGAQVGTPAYTAPESIRASEHSAHSDQFSMAATLYEALSGERAFPGQDAVAVARRIERESPLPIARALGLPFDVDAVLLRGMARAPSARYPNCGAFGGQLSAALLGHREVQLTLPDERLLARLAEPRQPPSRRLGTIVLCLLIGATAAVALQRLSEKWTDPGPPTPRPAYLSPAPPGPAR